MQIVIKGITNQGRTFRPSDWAQRLATAVASLGPDRRIHFHPRVHVAMRQGVPCVLVNAALKEEEPSLYAFLIGFATNNGLLIDDETEKHVAA